MTLCCLCSFFHIFILTYCKLTVDVASFFDSISFLFHFLIPRVYLNIFLSRLWILIICSSLVTSMCFYDNATQHLHEKTAFWWTSLNCIWYELELNYVVITPTTHCRLHIILTNFIQRLNYEPQLWRYNLGSWIHQEDLLTLPG